MSFNVLLNFTFLLLYPILAGCEFGTEDIADECVPVRDQFALATSDFTLCSIKHSRPITLCKKCKDSYINVLISYKNMSEVSYNGTTCLDTFVNLDRLQIVETQYSKSTDLWSRGKCSECYLIVNGTQTRNKTNEMSTFRSYYKSFKSCVKNNTDKTNLCQQCMSSYVTLHDYYFSISNSNEKISFCIDLVDKMNTTFTFWSNNCCKYRKHHEYGFIGSIAGVFVVTIFFYIAIQFCAEKRAPTIVQQTRFAESVSNARN